MRLTVYSNDQTDKNTESNRNSAIPNFMPRIPVDNKILERMTFLNSKQSVVDVVYNWAKIYAEQKGFNVKPVDILISGSRITGKSHLVRIICNAISKRWSFNYKYQESAKIESSFTGTNMYYIGETTIRSILRIN